MNIIVLIMAAFLITSCVPMPYKAKSVLLPDGQAGKVVDCRDIGICYERATKACSGVYEVMDKTSQIKTGTQPVFSRSSAQVYGKVGSLEHIESSVRAGMLEVDYIPITYTEYTLLIKCKAEKPISP